MIKHIENFAMQFIILLFFVLGACVTQEILVTRYDDNQIKFPVEDTNIDFDPDTYLSAPQIIRKSGYKSESHVVNTSDGYLLTIHRIPENKYGILGKQPIFLQHGLLSSSDDWVITENNSLAFILSDLGYDVWLGNSRGNKYSIAHISIPPDSDEFWNFSFHEMGMFDLPAVLTYILNTNTANGKITYIGHSMGTTMFYVLASKLPKFTENTVKTMVSLAPVAYMTYITSPIRYLAPFANDVNWIAKYLGIHQFLPNNEIMKLLSLECRLLDINKKFCEQVIFIICGFDQKEISERLLTLILAHDPSGTSTKAIMHYAQEIHEGGNFMEYDYGRIENQIKYGNDTPPTYNLTNINIPLYLIYAENDWLANPKDVFRLANTVSGNVTTYKIPLPTFNHVDYIFANDAPKLVYKNLIKYIKKM